jgi:hypothetical protein
MWHSIMTLPDGAEIGVNTDGDGTGRPYRVSRRGKKIGDFAELHDVTLFVRYRHGQATQDAFITAQQLSTLQRSPQQPARTR